MDSDKKREKLSNARLEYLANRELLLQKKVDELGLTLFDKINEKFLNDLEKDPSGKVSNNKKNIASVAQIDSIYNEFNARYNIPIIKSFTNDLNGIGPLNEKYFNEVVSAPTKVSRYRAETVVNAQLGIDRKGVPIKDGFTDKFIRDPLVVNSIKQKTLEGITQGKGFQQLRKDLKEYIAGTPKQPNTGKLHQYYRNNAYDTYTKVDRLYSDTMAKDLKLTFFYYSGGVINTTRKFCKYFNSKIVKAADFKKLKFSNLQIIYRSGVPDGSHSTWHPSIDLGGYGCRHTKDYISSKLALRRLSEMADINHVTMTNVKLTE